MAPAVGIRHDDTQAKLYSIELLIRKGQDCG